MSTSTKEAPQPHPPCRTPFSLATFVTCIWPGPPSPISKVLPGGYVPKLFVRVGDIRDVQIDPPVGIKVSRGNAHVVADVADSCAPGLVNKPAADVAKVAIRPVIDREIEVWPPVTVEVGEDRLETVVADREPDVGRDVLEMKAAQIAVEAVLAREPTGRAIGVSGSPPASAVQ